MEMEKMKEYVGKDVTVRFNDGRRAAGYLVQMTPSGNVVFQNATGSIQTYTPEVIAHIQKRPITKRGGYCEPKSRDPHGPMPILD